MRRYISMTLWAFSLAAVTNGMLFVSAYADLPPAKYLNVPTRHADVLFPVNASDFGADQLLFDAKPTADILVRISCSGSLSVYPFAIAIYQTSKDSFEVLAVVEDRTLDPAMRRRVSAPLEKGLGLRLLDILRMEFSRMIPGTMDRRVFLDTETYYYWLKIDKGAPAFGQTTSAVASDSRLERINQLAALLCSLANAPERDRVETIGRIDRAITEVELANKFAN